MISKNIKAGLIALVTLVLFFIVINYLKGTNIFKKGITLYAQYDNVDGLLETRPIFINGLKVGSISGIKVLPETGKLLVKMDVDTEFRIKNQSIALISKSFIGDAGMNIQLSSKGDLVQDGDTIQGRLDEDMMTVLTKEINPLKGKLEHVLETVDTTLLALKKIINDENTKQITALLENLNTTVQSFNTTANAVTKTSNSFNQTAKGIEGMAFEAQDLIKDNKQKLEHTLGEFDQTAANLNQLSAQLSEIDYKATITKLDTSLNHVNTLLADLEEGKGTLGKFMKDEEMYNNLKNASKEMELLLKDLKENPKRYVHFSIFGKKNKPYEEINKNEDLIVE